MRSASFAAIDLGASSGRVIVGRVGSGRVSISERRRFPNSPVALPDGLHWNLIGLYEESLLALRQVATDIDDLRGLAVDSWGVDYGLLDERGALIGVPFHYRDERSDVGVRKVQAVISAADLYRINGLQHLPFNTLFQLATEGRNLDRAKRLLLIPDLIGYWLTGLEVAEATNASTTGLVDVLTGKWSDQLIATLNLPRPLFADLVNPGQIFGQVAGRVARETGLSTSVLVSTVGSHDTASAIVAVPATDSSFAFVSCGTWALVGVELDRPVLSDQSRAANFTNERGVDGTIRYLRNVMGLWLLQETLRTWQLGGDAAELTSLLDVAGQLPRGGPVVDPDSPQFLSPGDVPARIRAACIESDQPPPSTRAELVRCILDSLATAIAKTIRDAIGLSGKRVDVVHLVGGGSGNRQLCQLVADACGLPLVAGPTEATSLGNVLTQAKAHGVVRGTLGDLRHIVQASTRTEHYLPSI